MLPLWRDRLQIFLAPDRVTVSVLSKGIKPRLVSSRHLVCRPAHSDESVWNPALEALLVLLGEVNVRGEASVVISNHFVRYQLIPASDDLSSVEEEEAYVSFHFSEVYGAVVEQWALRWGQGLALAPQIATAIDQSLLSSLDEIFKSATIHLVSLQPYLMAAFNRVRNLTSGSLASYILVEEGRALIGLLKGQEWMALRAVKLGSDWLSELPRLIEREFQVAGVESEQGQMLLCVPRHVDKSRFMISGWTVKFEMMSPETLLQKNSQALPSAGAH